MSSPSRALRVLVTDDDPAIRTVVREALRRAGHEVETAASLAEQERALRRFRPEVLVTDVLLPDGDGLAATGRAREHLPNLPVIVFSAQNTFTTAIRASERGAFDYLPKPFDLDELARLVSAAGATRAGTPENVPAQAEQLPLLGRSAPMQEVYRTIARVVGIDLTVLVLGESGTGKELVARVIHDFGPRAAAPFVPVNMAAIPRERIEHELFGEERSGAGGLRPGRFGQAQGGTLFLDEVGDMPLEAQTRLVRVLQSGEFTPIGSARPIRADVRIVAATHQDLARRIAEGAFREDLFYRLDVVPVRLPPLRDRAEDIAELAHHFLGQAAAEGLPRRTLDAAAVRRLERHAWPGNVRELENLMRRLAALSRDPVIRLPLIERQLQSAAGQPASAPALAEGAELGEAMERHIARYFARYGRDLPPDGLYDRVLAEMERPLLRLTLAAVRGNQLRAAKLLGLNRNTLRKKLTGRAVGPAPRGSERE